MNITPELRAVFKRVISEYGNASQFAKSIGVAHSTVLFWLSGKSPNVSGKLWLEKVRPALLPFLSRDERQRFAPELPFSTSSRASSLSASSSASSRKPAPLFSVGQLLEFDPVFESIENFIRRTPRIGSCPFTVPTTPVRFALKCPAPALPFELNALIDGSARPHPGEIAVAAIQNTERILIATFYRAGDEAELLPFFEKNADKIRWNTRFSPNYLRWIFPVLEFDRILK